MLTINNLDKIVGYSITDMFETLQFTNIIHGAINRYLIEYNKTSLVQQRPTIGIIRLDRLATLSPDDKMYQLSQLSSPDENIRFISAPASQGELLQEIGKLIYAEGHPFSVCTPIVKLQ